MANWCSNVVHFECGNETLEQLINFFDEMAAKQASRDCGQLPAFVGVDKGYMFEIYWDSGTLYYETKWCPNIAVMQVIADHFGAGFAYSYDELGNLVYGEAEYRYGILTDVYLGLPDFEAYTFNEGTDTYFFEGNEYGNDYEILELLLDRKKQQLAQFTFSANN